jgi:hypothetical protein
MKNKHFSYNIIQNDMFFFAPICTHARAVVITTEYTDLPITEEEIAKIGNKFMEKNLQTEKLFT